MKQRTKSKFRILKGFDQLSKAQTYLDSCNEENLSIRKKIWKGKDKTRFYVRALVRKGTK